MDKFSSHLVCVLLALMMSFSSHAENGVIKVAVPYFAPPFVMQGGNNELFGFDIATMKSLCKQMNINCIYKHVIFDNIFNSLANGEVDVGIGRITISPERAPLVNFTIPYLPSDMLFITQTKNATTPFTFTLLKNKKIAMLKGSLFSMELQLLGLQSNTFSYYINDEEVIDALNNGEVDFAVLDSASAIYWENHSSDLLKTVGYRIAYGNGLGIAINKNQVALLAQFNKAIKDYEKSNDFQSNYDLYF